MEDAIEETILEAVALIAEQKGLLFAVIYNEPGSRNKIDPDHGAKRRF